MNELKTDEELILSRPLIQTVDYEIICILHLWYNENSSLQSFPRNLFSTFSIRVVNSFSGSYFAFVYVMVWRLLLNKTIIFVKFR